MEYRDGEEREYMRRGNYVVYEWSTTSRDV